MWLDGVHGVCSRPLDCLSSCPSSQRGSNTLIERGYPTMTEQYRYMSRLTVAVCRKPHVSRAYGLHTACHAWSRSGTRSSRWLHHCYKFRQRGVFLAAVTLIPCAPRAYTCRPSPKVLPYPSFVPPLHPSIPHHGETKHVASYTCTHERVVFPQSIKIQSVTRQQGHGRNLVVRIDGTSNQFGQNIID